LGSSRVPCRNCRSSRRSCHRWHVSSMNSWSMTPAKELKLTWVREKSPHPVWTPDKHLAVCRAILELYGVTLKVHTSFESMPKTKRAFEDSHFSRFTLHQLYSPDTGAERLIESLWHEVGHLVTSDKNSRAGVNWVDPYPAHAHRRCELPKCWWDRHRNTTWYVDRRNEANACYASASLLRLLRVPLLHRLLVNGYVSHDSTHQCHNRTRVRQGVRSVFRKLMALER
jgi:hypothetical protein